MNAEDAFAPTSDRSHFFASSAANAVLVQLEQGLIHAQPVTVVTGEPGVGKTCVLREACARWGARVRAEWLEVHGMSPDELLSAMIRVFEGHVSDSGSHTERVAELVRALGRVTDSDQTPVLVIENVHTLAIEMLRELARIVSATEAANSKFRVVLSGQTGLEKRLEDPALSSLAGLISARTRHLPLHVTDVRPYLNHRIAAAGGDGERVFSRRSARELHTVSHGVPGHLDAIASDAIKIARGTGAAQVAPEQVKAAVAAMQRPRTSAAPAATRAATAASQDEAQVKTTSEPKASASVRTAAPVSKLNAAGTPPTLTSANATPSPAPASQGKPAATPSSSATPRPAAANRKSGTPAPNTPAQPAMPVAHEPAGTAPVSPHAQASTPAAPDMPQRPDAPPLDSGHPRVKEWVSRFTDGQGVLRFGARMQLPPLTEPDALPVFDDTPPKSAVTTRRMSGSLRSKPKADEVAEAARAAKAAQLAEEARITEIERVTEAERVAELERVAAIERMAEAERVAEIARVAEIERRTEAARVAEIERVSEIERKAQAARVAEAERVVELERIAEARLAAEAARAEVERAAQQKRAADLARAAEQKRAAEAARAAAQAAAAQAAAAQAAARAAAAEAARVADAAAPIAFVPQPEDDSDATTDSSAPEIVIVPEPIVLDPAALEPPPLELPEVESEIARRSAPIGSSHQDTPPAAHQPTPPVVLTSQDASPKRSKKKQKRERERQARAAQQTGASSTVAPSAPAAKLTHTPSAPAKPMPAAASVSPPVRMNQARRAMAPDAAGAQQPVTPASDVPTPSALSNGPRSPRHTNKFVQAAVPLMLMVGVAAVAIFASTRTGFEQNRPRTQSAGVTPVVPESSYTAPTAPSPAPQAPVAAPAAPAQYCLAVGTYLFSDRAHVKAKQLAKRTRMKAWVETTRADGSNSYRILIGGFATESEAERAADRLLGRGLVSEALVESLPKAGRAKR